MKMLGKIVEFSITLTVAITLILFACFEKTLVRDVKIILVFLGLSSLIASIISIVNFAIEDYKEREGENKDDK